MTHYQLKRLKEGDIITHIIDELDYIYKEKIYCIVNKEYHALHVYCNEKKTFSRFTDDFLKNFQRKTYKE